MDRFDLEIDINYPSHVATMYNCENGKYVEAEEAQERIDFLVDALKNLKSCDVRYNTPAELNIYVNSVLEGYL